MGQILEQTPNIAEIIVVIDAEKLVREKKGGTEASPTFIPYAEANNYIYMVTSPEIVRAGQATGFLHIKVDTGINVEWFGQSIQPIRYDVLLRSLLLWRGDITTEPMFRSIERTHASQPRNQPLGTVFSTFYMGRWYVTTEGYGEVDYYFVFEVFDTATRESQGVYKWDPRIEITRS